MFKHHHFITFHARLKLFILKLMQNVYLLHARFYTFIEKVRIVLASIWSLAIDNPLSTFRFQMLFS